MCVRAFVVCVSVCVFSMCVHAGTHMDVVFVSHTWSARWGEFSVTFSMKTPDHSVKSSEEEKEALWRKRF